MYVETTSTKMLTTIDNPWSPFTNFDEWRAFDENAGYNTLGLLANIAGYAPDREADVAENDMQLAMYEVYSMMPGLYRIVEEKRS